MQPGRERDHNDDHLHERGRCHHLVRDHRDHREHRPHDDLHHRDRHYPAQHQQHGTATTTTTETLSSAETRLPNGHIKAMGFIDKVYVKDGKRYISIDYAEMLTGAAANAAAVAAGFIEPGEDVPNDYWISNANPQKRVFEVSDTVAITTSTGGYAGEDRSAVHLG